MKCCVCKLVYTLKAYWSMYLPLKWTIGNASIWASAPCVILSNLYAIHFVECLPKIQNNTLYFTSNNCFVAPDPFKIIFILLFTTNLRIFLFLFVIVSAFRHLPQMFHKYVQF